MKASFHGKNKLKEEVRMRTYISCYSIKPENTMRNESKNNEKQLK